MSQNSGKIAVALGLVVCAAGLGYAFNQKDVAVVSLAAKAPATGASFQAPAPASLPDSALGWSYEKPAPRPEGGHVWAHDLFTPVEVSWNAKLGEYVPKGEVTTGSGPVAIEKFGLNLISLKRRQYRYRIMSIMAAPSGKPADAIITLQDIVSKALVRGKAGQFVGQGDAKVKIISSEDTIVKQPGGASAKVKIVKVDDVSLRRQVMVRETPVELADRLDIVFAEEGAATPVWTAAAVGDTFEFAGASFAIKGVDFETQTVTVTKSWKEPSGKQGVKTMTEELRPVEPPAAPPAAEKK